MPVEGLIILFIIFCGTHMSGFDLNAKGVIAGMKDIPHGPYYYWEHVEPSTELYNILKASSDAKFGQFSFQNDDLNDSKIGYVRDKTFFVDLARAPYFILRGKYWEVDIHMFFLPSQQVFLPMERIVEHSFVKALLMTDGFDYARKRVAEQPFAPDIELSSWLPKGQILGL
jgi:hypothetical protein